VTQRDPRRELSELAKRAPGTPEGQKIVALAALVETLENVDRSLLEASRRSEESARAARRWAVFVAVATGIYAVAAVLMYIFPRVAR
jgi:hypothetical protein